MRFLLLLLPCFCLGAAADPRIVGGEAAEISSHPYAAVVFVADLFFCGGIIVSEKYVLTAAWCVTRSKDLPMSVRVGSSFRKRGGVVHEVARTCHHPKYTNASIDYDLGVMELLTPIAFNENASAIGIGDCEPKKGAEGTVVGWGLLSDWTFPGQLHKAVVPVIDRDKCGKMLNFKVPKRMICTYQRGRYPFLGDAGGAIVVDGKAVGSVAYRHSDHPGKYPTVYMSFAEKEMRTFIKEVTGV